MISPLCVCRAETIWAAGSGSRICSQVSCSPGGPDHGKKWLVVSNWMGTKPLWLVVSIPLKNIGQLGWLFPIYGKIKHVPNHQPVMQYWCPSCTQHSIGTSFGCGFRCSAPPKAKRAKAQAHWCAWRRMFMAWENYGGSRGNHGTTYPICSMVLEYVFLSIHKFWVIYGVNVGK